MKNKLEISGHVGEARFIRIYQTKNGGSLLSFFLLAPKRRPEAKPFSLKCVIFDTKRALEMKEQLYEGRPIELSGHFEIHAYKDNEENWQRSAQLEIETYTFPEDDQKATNSSSSDLFTREAASTTAPTIKDADIPF